MGTISVKAGTNKLDRVGNMERNPTIRSMRTANQRIWGSTTNSAIQQATGHEQNNLFQTLFPMPPLLFSSLPLLIIPLSVIHPKQWRLRTCNMLTWLSHTTNRNQIKMVLLSPSPFHFFPSINRTTQHYRGTLIKSRGISVTQLLCL